MKLWNNQNCKPSRCQWERNRFIWGGRRTLFSSHFSVSVSEQHGKSKRQVILSIAFVEQNIYPICKDDHDMEVTDASSPQDFDSTQVQRPNLRKAEF